LCDLSTSSRIGCVFLPDPLPLPEFHLDPKKLFKKLFEFVTEVILELFLFLFLFCKSDFSELNEDLRF
ncbi:MAG: hypothetical protein RSB23_05140, partial [Alistipes sp.]